MNAEQIRRIESMLDRTLSAAEKERLGRIQNALGMADNDALWDVLAAMEYQRTFYEGLPQKISQAVAEIFKGLSHAADNEIALAQSRLAESVVEQAKKLSVKTHVHTWLMWGALTVVLLLLYGSLLLWAGYCIGSGQTQPPALLLRMPVGIIVGTLCIGGGIFSGVLAARDFAEDHARWRRRMLTALAFLLPGGWVLSLALL